MALKSCGHNHGDPLQDHTCKLRDELVRDAGQRACAVIVLRDAGMPALSMFGNETSFAQFMLAIGEYTARLERPTDCPKCADAYDRILQARAILTPTAGRC